MHKIKKLTCYRALIFKKFHFEVKKIEESILKNAKWYKKWKCAFLEFKTHYQILINTDINFRGSHYDTDSLKNNSTKHSIISKKRPNGQKTVINDYLYEAKKTLSKKHFSKSKFHSLIKARDSKFSLA